MASTNGCRQLMLAAFAAAFILQVAADGRLLRQFVSVRGEHGAQAIVGDRLRSLLSSGKPFLREFSTYSFNGKLKSETLKFVPLILAVKSRCSGAPTTVAAAGPLTVLLCRLSRAAAFGHP